MNRSFVGVSVATLVAVLAVCSVNIQSAAIPKERPYYEERPYYDIDSDGNGLTRNLEVFKTWSKSRLTYSVMNYPVGFPEETIRSTVRRAFHSWSRVTNLDFMEIINTPQVDIQLAFEGTNHSRRGKPCQFEREITLAHAFLPEVGDVHFNTKYFFNDESISINHFLNTAIHEIGHALGLMHSNSKESIMYGAQLSDPFTEPQPEDIEAIQAAYGIRQASAVTTTTTTTTTPTTTTTTTTTTPQPITSTTSTTTSSKTPMTQPTKSRRKSTLCFLTSYDTIVKDHQGNICVLAGRFYYNLNETNNPERKISDKWPGLPPYVDAGFTYPDGKTYFYKDNEYWKYDQWQLQQNYPRPIASGFLGIPNNIDAILLVKTGGFVAFKGSSYWFYDTRRSIPMVKGYYPKSNEDILGFSGRVDAALMTDDGRRFVFSGMKYYEVSDGNRVTGGEGDVRRDWLNC